MIDEGSVALARAWVRRLAGEAGLGVGAAEGLVTAASELAYNQLNHARRAVFYARRIERGGVPGVEVVAADEGPGIAQPTLALKGLAPSRTGLGSGLAGASRLAEELDFDVRQGEGTCVRARAFAGPVPFRSEVAILGRALEHESVSGDDACFVRRGDEVVLALADGLGHGPLAREASSRAMAVVEQRPGLSPERVLEECEESLSGTRGAVMVAARWEGRSRRLEQAAIGDVTLQAVWPRESRHFNRRRGIVGLKQAHRSVVGESAVLGPGAMVLAYSDGLKSGIDLSGSLELLREHPLVVAEHLLTHYARPTDDALVLVLR
jgi:anti-sigma regulatory factor (Ser/Thr protein kinase)